MNVVWKIGYTGTSKIFLFKYLCAHKTFQICYLNVRNRAIGRNIWKILFIIFGVNKHYLININLRSIKF